MPLTPAPSPSDTTPIPTPTSISPANTNDHDVAPSAPPVVPTPADITSPTTSTTGTTSSPITDNTNKAAATSPTVDITSTTTQLPVVAESSTSPTSPRSPGLLEVLGRGQRTKKPSVLLKNFLIHSSTATHPPHASTASDPSSSTSVSGKTQYPIANYTSVSMFNASHQAFLATITTESVPSTFKEAVRDPRFNKAMKTEVTALEEQHTSFMDVDKIFLAPTILHTGRKRLSPDTTSSNARMVECVGMEYLPGKPVVDNT